jgi:DNA-binding PucR family transcriptional regulator
VLTQLHQETYLSPLDGLRVGGQTVRETLRAYECCEGNISAAGAKLGVDRRTVLNRLRAVETTLDQHLNVCSPRIGVALRLEELLGVSTGYAANRPA